MMSLSSSSPPLSRLGVMAKTVRDTGLPSACYLFTARARLLESHRSGKDKPLG